VLNPPEQRIIKSTQERRQEFQRRIEGIRSEWAFLEAERKSKLDEPRPMVFGHFELVEETLETESTATERACLSAPRR
jgi:sugar-specific transcriptional regulator TrmB